MDRVRQLGVVGLTIHPVRAERPAPTRGASMTTSPTDNIRNAVPTSTGKVWNARHEEARATRLGHHRRCRKTITPPTVGKTRSQSQANRGERRPWRPRWRCMPHRIVGGG